MSDEWFYGWRFLNGAGGTNEGWKKREHYSILPRPGEKWSETTYHPNPAKRDGFDCGPNRLHVMLELSSHYAPASWWIWRARWRKEWELGRSETKASVTAYQLRRVRPAVLWKMARLGRLQKTSFVRANFVGANLQGAKFANSHLDEVNFRGANLTGASLAGAVLSSANLRGAFLIGANLNRIIAYDACFAGANMTGVTVDGANFGGASLQNATLNGADLRTAFIEHAILDGANLRGAIISEQQKAWIKNTHARNWWLATVM